MAEKKKYHWLKLPDNFFKRHDIKIIKQMDNGEKYVIFYQQLLLESISHDGELRFSELIPYDEKMLGIITDTDIDIVRSAMKLLVDLGMVQILDDATIFMTDCEKMIGSDKTSTERVQKHREKLRLECESMVIEDETQCNVSETFPSNSISNSNSLSITNKKEPKKFIPPTYEEVVEYACERGSFDQARVFFDYYSTGDWKDREGKQVRNWKQKFISWCSRNQTPKKKDNRQSLHEMIESGVFDE